MHSPTSFLLPFLQAAMRARRKANQEESRMKKSRVSGSAAMKAEGKARSVAVSKEASARRFDDEDIEREVAQARAAACQGMRQLGAAAPLPLEGVPHGFTATLFVGAPAGTAVRGYEKLLAAAYVHGGGTVLDVNSWASDEELATVELPSGHNHNQMQAVWDRVCHDDHWTQPQMAAARKAGGDSRRHGQSLCALLRDTRGCSCAVLLATHTREGCTIEAVHTRLAWRRRQLAEVLWRQLLQAMPVPTKFVVVAACCQAGTAGRFWGRMGFTGTADVERLLRLRENSTTPHKIQVGEYQLSYTSSG